MELILKKQLINLYINKKFSMAKVAKIFDCSASFICHKMKEYCIKARSKTEGYEGKGNPNYKNVKPKCIDCRQTLSHYVKNIKRCQECYFKFIARKKNYCIDCGKELVNPYSKRCSSCANKGKNNGMYGRICKLNPNYIDGRSYIDYPQEFNKELKDQIRNRDNHTCQNCGMTEEEHIIILGTVLSIHHIDYDKQNCNKENLITLCNQCNTRVNYNRNYWAKYFQNKMENKLCLSKE